jgi:spore coat polysaccharide biosynthesis protein SpsF
MGSTRLPGKVLALIGSRTVLEHCLERAAAVSGIHGVCLATSDLASDDPVAETAARLSGVVVFRGHPTDVLSRYRDAAVKMRAEVILRITCDCPLLDPDVCGAVLALRANSNAPYAHNNATDDWPRGLDCEAFTREALLRAAREANDAYDREHVGPWMRRSAGTRAAHLPGPGGTAARYRWALDYHEDLVFLRTLWPHLPADRYPSWQEVAAVLDCHPEIVAINAMHSVCQAATTDIVS